ncbi:sensor histidine kinase [Cellulosilyticum sp. I15G10I2]|uniref:sensor histidine kinase n=1 Tax=Cellulosilyticum sp. I15G10I2 TaxID=1892843 RepID=UPI00085C1F06|nr:HAMP domain-containing sensor histidine kinase [Cellulosilyticum sp. I15G10I2]
MRKYSAKMRLIITSLFLTLMYSYSVEASDHIPKEKLIIEARYRGDLFLIQIIIVLIIVVVILIINIIQKQKTENLLRQSEEGYKELLMGIPNSVILIEDKEIKFINQHGIELLGQANQDKVTYSKLKEIFVKDVDFEALDAIPRRIECHIRTLHNEVKEVEVTTVAKSKKNHSKSVIMLIQDISHRRLLCESIERDRIRNEFFANLSHEFKTPINLLITTSKLLEKIQYKEDLQRVLPKAIRILKQNGYRLIRLINNIIDAAMIDSGCIKLNLNNYNIIQLTEDIILSTVSYARANDIAILFDTAIEELVTAIDRHQYERIILNLISNAIKYNKKNGQILVYMYPLKGEIIISIKDTGIGISSKMLPYIFDRFMQVNKSLIRDVEGSGIGLALVKSLVQLHHGRIEVFSKEGEGTEVILYFPIHMTKTIDKELSEKVLFKHKSRNTEIELSDIYVKEDAY